MPMRVSITIDADTMDLVDKFAKGHGLDRNRAILECIETGYARLTDGSPVTVTKHRSFEEYNELKLAVDEIRTTLENLTQEVRLIHHIVEVEWRKEIRGVPYQSRKWYEFWKSQ